MYGMESSRASRVMLLHVVLVALLAVAIVSCDTAFGQLEDRVCKNGYVRAEGGSCEPGPCKLGSKRYPEGTVVVSRHCCLVTAGPFYPQPVCEKKVEGKEPRKMCYCACVRGRMVNLLLSKDQYLTSSGGFKSCKVMKALARRESWHH
eukprot:scpid96624/ scgid27379/ 